MYGIRASYPSYTSDLQGFQAFSKSSLSYCVLACTSPIALCSWPAKRAIRRG